MSATKHIFCEECKKSIWVGQGSNCFYSGEPETMRNLGKFLFAHEGHHLVFAISSHNDDIVAEELT